jgi:ketosteroid isomerase-like protein
MPSTARDTAERFLAATTGTDPGDLADFYAPHVVIDMPFAPAALYPARTEIDRESLRARLRSGAAVRRYERVSRVRIHETADPEVVIVEYDLHGRLTTTGEPFTLSFLMVMTVQDGLIVHTRDYTDPIAGARVLGRLPALLEALAAAPA